MYFSFFVPDVNPPCGGYLSGSGSFSSPYYPNYYHDNAHCVWRLSAPSGQRILLTFSDLEWVRISVFVFSHFPQFKSHPLCLAWLKSESMSRKQKMFTVADDMGGGFFIHVSWSLLITTSVCFLQAGALLWLWLHHRVWRPLGRLQSAGSALPQLLSGYLPLLLQSHDRALQKRQFSREAWLPGRIH